jgi:hypothetical protein
VCTATIFDGDGSAANPAADSAANPGHGHDRTASGGSGGSVIVHDRI